MLTTIGFKTVGRLLPGARPYHRQFTPRNQQFCVVFGRLAFNFYVFKKTDARLDCVKLCMGGRMDQNAHTLDRQESQQLLKTAISRQVTAILSYMSKNKWHVAKVYMIHVDENELYVESMHPETKRQPLNIQVGQPVGISFKYAYGKFIFDAAVTETTAVSESMSSFK